MSTTTPAETQQYINNCESLIKARTEQLRTSVKGYELLLQTLRSVIQAESLEQAKRIAQEAFDKRLRAISADHAAQ
jgi:hypothetical protein